MMTPETPEAIDVRIEGLRQEILELGAKKRVLLRRANGKPEPKPEPTPEPPEPLTEREETYQRIEALIEREGPVQLAQVTGLLGSDKYTAQRRLREMVAKEVLARIGVKRGARYHLADEAPETPEMRDYRTLIRDAGRRLGSFTTAELYAELPTMSKVTVQRWCKRLLDDGTFTAVQVGRELLYDYVKPTPEIVVAQAKSVPRRGRQAVAGTGGKKRIGRRETRELVASAKAQGATVREAKHGHVVFVDGKPVGSVAKTASDTRSNRNTRADLKRAGLKV